MSDWFNCPIHGGRRVDRYDDGCPDCRNEREEDEYRAGQDREEVKRSLAENARKRANPGDYECPHCKYVSLKNGASRCPLCRGEVGSEYWGVVRAREKADAEAAAERRKVDDERQRAEVAAAEASKAAAQRAAAAEWQRRAPQREAAGQLADLERRIRSIKYGAMAGNWLGLALAGVVVALSLSLALRHALPLLIAPVSGAIARIVYLRRKALTVSGLNRERLRLLDLAEGGSVSTGAAEIEVELSPDQKLAFLKKEIAEIGLEIEAISTGKSPGWLWFDLVASDWSRQSYLRGKREDLDAKRIRLESRIKSKTRP